MDGYTGKWQRETDNSTALIRMGVREYDPTLGRFTSPDPLKGTPTDPQQRNRYPYVGNDPLVRYDLDGLWWGGDAWGWFKDRASDVSNYVHDPQHTAFTGYIPPEKRPFANNGFVQVLNSDAVGMGLLVTLGLPGGFGTAGEFGEAGGALCTYEDIKVGRSVGNIATNVTREEFERNLIDSGWTRSVSSDGLAVNYTKDGAKYSVRDVASGWPGSTADYYPPGSKARTLEIRLGK